MKQKVKKTVLGILAASMVLSTGTATTFAARTGCGHYYVDANSDGICDNRGNGNTKGNGRKHGNGCHNGRGKRR